MAVHAGCTHLMHTAGPRFWEHRAGHPMLGTHSQLKTPGPDSGTCNVRQYHAIYKAGHTKLDTQHQSETLRTQHQAHSPWHTTLNTQPRACTHTNSKMLSTHARYTPWTYNMCQMHSAEHTTRHTEPHTHCQAYGAGQTTTSVQHCEHKVRHTGPSAKCQCTV